MAEKKLILTESMLKRLVSDGIIAESNVDDVIKSRDFEKKVKDIATDAIKNDKEVEKMVKKVVAKTVDTLFRTLWQRSNFYQNEILK